MWAASSRVHCGHCKLLHCATGSANRGLTTKCSAVREIREQLTGKWCWARPQALVTSDMLMDLVHPTHSNAATLALSLAGRKRSASEITEEYLERAEQLESKLHSFITLDRDGARAQVPPPGCKAWRGSCSCRC